MIGNFFQSFFFVLVYLFPVQREKKAVLLLKILKKVALLKAALLLKMKSD